MFASVHNSCFPQPGRGCSLSQGHARFRCGRCRWMEPVRANIERQARRRPVIRRDAGQDWFAERNCFPTACLVQPRAAKFSWFVAACLHQYCERNDVGFVRRPLLDWGSDGPELCPLRPHEPRFTRLACASAVKIGAQAGPPLTAPGVIVVVQSALVPQSSNLFVPFSKQIRSP